MLFGFKLDSLVRPESSVGNATGGDVDAARISGSENLLNSANFVLQYQSDKCKILDK